MDSGLVAQEEEVVFGELLMSLSAAPSEEALRSGLASAFGLSTSLINKLQWFLNRRRLRQIHEGRSLANSWYVVAYEFVVPNGTARQSVLSKADALGQSDSKEFATLQKLFNESYGIEMDRVSVTVAARAIKISVIRNADGELVPNIMDQEAGTRAPPTSEEEGGTEMLIVLMVIGIIVVLLLGTALFCTCRHLYYRSKSGRKRQQAKSPSTSRDLLDPGWDSVSGGNKPNLQRGASGSSRGNLEETRKHPVVESPVPLEEITPEQKMDPLAAQSAAEASAWEEVTEPVEVVQRHGTPDQMPGMPEAAALVKAPKATVPEGNDRAPKGHVIFEVGAADANPQEDDREMKIDFSLAEDQGVRSSDCTCQRPFFCGIGGARSRSYPASMVPVPPESKHLPLTPL